MNDALLILNAGSSSIKFSLYRAVEVPQHTDLLCDGQLSGIGHTIHFLAIDANGKELQNTSLPDGVGHETALNALLRWCSDHYSDQHLIGAGHRVVHGGRRYDSPTLISAEVANELRRLIPLAPLHQPHHLAAIDALTRLYPELPQVACFDTAFHHGQPELATTFAIPRKLTEEGVRRYGFHGLSYEYIASQLPHYLPHHVCEGRIVIAHLGSGASMCAVLDGKSIATTMGFTALDGLPMSRRCGNIDPGVVLYLMQEKGMSADAISKLLYGECGLFGVSGISDDMQTLLASDDPRAKQAIDLFIYRIGRELGSLVAALGGLDALVFTAGIGEHAALIRQGVCESASWLDIRLDYKSNENGNPCITRQGSKVSAWIIPTDEDLMIARHTAKLLGLG